MVAMKSATEVGRSDSTALPSALVRPNACPPRMPPPASTVVQALARARPPGGVGGKVVSQVGEERGGALGAPMPKAVGGEARPARAVLVFGRRPGGRHRGGRTLAKPRGGIERPKKSGAVRGGVE